MNRIVVGTLALLCVLSSTLALTQVQSPRAGIPQGSLEGVVLNRVTGQPIEGVQVTVVPGQPIPEAGVQTALPKPTQEVPQTKKVIPALAIGGRTLMRERTAHSVLTDSGGRFKFSGLQPDSYSLSVSADGYIFQILGEKPESGTWLPITVGNSNVDAGVLRMSPQVRITGAVVDSSGRPIANIPVYLLNASPTISVDGEKRLRVAGDPLVDTFTDANGHYVFEKVKADRYYVAVGSPGRSAAVRISQNARVDVPALLPYPYAYYPGVSDVSQAWQIEAPAGGQLALNNLVIRDMQLRSIRGRVVDSIAGKPPVSVEVRLNVWFPFQRRGDLDSRDYLSVVRYNQNTGIFEAANLIPGIYRVDADLPMPRTSSSDSSQSRTGSVPVQSAFQIFELRDRDVQDLVIAVPNNGRVAGKVVVAEGKPLPIANPNSTVSFTLQLRPIGPLQPNPIAIRISPQDGSFEVSTGLEGKYRFWVSPLSDNYFVSETWLDGVRVTNGILNFVANMKSELILSLSPGGEFQGSVVDKNGQPVEQAQGILLPDPLPETIPFYNLFDADASGGFKITNIPPGNYKIYVWNGIELNQFFDRELLLRSQRLASSVQVEKGSRVTASVPIIVP